MQQSLVRIDILHHLSSEGLGKIPRCLHYLHYLHQTYFRAQSQQKSVEISLVEAYIESPPRTDTSTLTTNFATGR